MLQLWAWCGLECPTMSPFFPCLKDFKVHSISLWPPLVMATSAGLPCKAHQGNIVGPIIWAVIRPTLIATMHTHGHGVTHTFCPLYVSGLPHMLCSHGQYQCCPFCSHQCHSWWRCGPRNAGSSRLLGGRTKSHRRCSCPFQKLQVPIPIPIGQWKMASLFKTG